jgi:hypothetical protein
MFLINLVAMLQDAAMSPEAAKNVNALLGAGIGIGLAIMSSRYRKASEPDGALVWIFQL